MRVVGIPCLFRVPIAPSRVLGLCSGLDSQAPRLCGQLSRACQHVSKKASAWASPVPLRSGTTPCDCTLSQPAASCLVGSGHQPAAPLRLCFSETSVLSLQPPVGPVSFPGLCPPSGSCQLGCWGCTRAQSRCVANSASPGSSQAPTASWTRLCSGLCLLLLGGGGAAEGAFLQLFPRLSIISAHCC